MDWSVCLYYCGILSSRFLQLSYGTVIHFHRLGCSAIAGSLLLSMTHLPAGHMFLRSGAAVVELNIRSKSAAEHSSLGLRLASRTTLWD